VAAVVRPLWVRRLSWRVALDTFPDAHDGVNLPIACPGRSRILSTSLHPLPEQRLASMRRRGTVTWCSSAVNCCRLSLLAAPRTRVQGAQRVAPTLCLGRGRLLRVLLGRSSSLRTLRRRFSAFVRALRRSTRPSDSPPTFVLDLWFITFSNRPAHYLMSGAAGAARISRVEFPYVQGSSTSQSPAGARNFALVGVAFRL
jgi:hypothetical protein